MNTNRDDDLISRSALLDEMMAGCMPVDQSGLSGVLGDEDSIRSYIESAPAVKAEPVIEAFWHYYTNDEGRARWKCTHCGKLCHKRPHDKRRCSSCGAHMRMEA